MTTNLRGRRRQENLTVGHGSAASDRSGDPTRRVRRWLLTPGGAVASFMTGPDGEQYHGWWQVREVDAPNALEVQDGFAYDDGEPNPDLPVNIMRMELVASGAITQMTIRSTFPTREAMEQTIAMGAEEGMKQALGQIDDLLADGGTTRV